MSDQQPMRGVSPEEVFKAIAEDLRRWETVLAGSLRPVRADAPGPREEWRIEIDGDRFYFRRYINGKVNESYRPVLQAEAAVWASAIIQGFQPPRSLQESDKPAG